MKLNELNDNEILLIKEALLDLFDKRKDINVSNGVDPYYGVCEELKDRLQEIDNISFLIQECDRMLPKKVYTEDDIPF